MLGWLQCQLPNFCDYLYLCSPVAILLLFALFLYLKVLFILLYHFISLWINIC